MCYEEGCVMKKQFFSLILLVSTLLECADSTIVLRDGWQLAAENVTTALSSMIAQLSEDIDAFDSMYDELCKLDVLVQEYDEADRVFLSGLQQRFDAVWQAYNDCLRQQDDVKTQASYDVQQLKIVLKSMPVIFQQRVDALNDVYTDAQVQLQKLIDCYNQLIKDNSNDVDKLVTLLRKICDQYVLMTEHKQLAFGEIDSLINVLSSHVDGEQARLQEIVAIKGFAVK